MPEHQDLSASNAAMGDASGFILIDPINEEFLNKRSNEKAELQQLNSRFASYIEKIRSLKQQNQELIVEVESMRSFTSTSITEMRTEEMNKLTHEKETLTSEISSVKVERDKLQTRLEQEIRLKEEAEKTCDDLRKELEAEKQKLKKETEELQKKIEFEKKVHKQEVSELKEKVRETQTPGSDETDMSKSELQVVLEGIRENYERIAAENINKAETLYKDQIKELNKTVSENGEELTEAQQKIKELNGQISILTSENSSLKSTTKEMEDRHKTERSKLESNIIQIKGEMANQLFKYQKLLSVKMALDVEINFYKMLLEEEELRIGMSTPDNSTVKNPPAGPTANTSPGNNQPEQPDDPSDGQEPETENPSGNNDEPNAAPTDPDLSREQSEMTLPPSDDQSVNVDISIQKTTMKERLIETSIIGDLDSIPSNQDLSKGEQSEMTLPPSDGQTLKEDKTIGPPKAEAQPTSNNPGSGLKHPKKSSLKFPGLFKKS
ncbi:desmin isoform X2 [Kryptolebias marmoratus]|uniref:desmin isoform X2 n=1 Tax=Kryptolebias marmoratus TaxID=37003 RepID=UPI000D52FDF7|nr:desmin isoform X2 [Kryptolebias marmoratus]